MEEENSETCYNVGCYDKYFSYERAIPVWSRMDKFIDRG